MSEGVRYLNAGNPVVRLLLGLTLTALLVSGLTADPLTGAADLPTASPTATQIGTATGEVIEDEIELVARKRKHPRAQAGRLTYRGWFDLVFVQFKPPLKNKAYKVALQVKRNGKWVRQSVARSFNARHEGKRVEYARLWSKPLPKVGNRRLRVVIPAQHGFQRTVIAVRNIEQCSWLN